MDAINIKSRRLYYINRITNLFLETDADRLKVEEIASSIGVTKKTLYNYFDSKKQMKEIIVDCYLKREINEIRQQVLHGINSVDTLICLGRSLSKIYQGCTHLLLPYSKKTDESSMNQILEEHRTEFLDITHHIVSKGIKEELFESDIDPKLVSHLYISGVLMFFLANKRSGITAMSKDHFNQVLYYLIKGCCTQKGLSILRETIDVKVIAY